MIPMATQFEDRTFRYTQVARQGDVAIYRQTHKASDIDRFEVVRIRIAEEHTWPDGRTTPEREVYPHANSWGALGWTFYKREDAEVKMQSLQTDKESTSE